MKLLDKLIRKTRIYQDLFRELGICKQEHTKLEFMYNEQHEYLLSAKQDVDKLTQIIKSNKKYARKIHQLTKDKEIRNLCNKILKGEK